MKATVCILLLAASAVYGVEEKKNEKRGLLGLGYGFAAAPAPLLGHGFAAAPAPLLGHGLGLGLGPGLGLGLYGHGLVGHGALVAPAPVVSHATISHGVPLSVGSPLLGLGHGYLH